MTDTPPTYPVEEIMATPVLGVPVDEVPFIEAPASFEDADGFEKERFLSTNTIAEMFEVTNETIRNWIAEGKLKAFKLGPIWRVPRSEVVRFANEHFGED